MLGIFMGNRCNFQCGYCLQPKGSTPAVSPNLQRIADFLLQNKQIDIAYWGGEPLLYWDVLTSTHKALSDLGVTNGNVIVSNGSLITSEKVEWLNAHDFYVAISWHHQDNRVDWDAVAGLNKCSVTYLYHHQQMDIQVYHDFIDQLQHRTGTGFHTFISWCRATQRCPEQYFITFDDIPVIIQGLLEATEKALQGDDIYRGILISQLVEWHQCMRSPYNGEPYCCNSTQISVDLAGRVYPCHYCVGQGQDLGIIGRHSVTKAITHFVDSPECQDCEIVRWCKGNCFISKTHEVDCALAKAKHELYMEVAPHVFRD